MDSLLGDDERHRAARLRDPSARSRFVTGRALLRLVLAAHLDRAPRTLQVVQRCRVCGSTSHGRPQVAGVMTSVSITHGGDLVGVALSDAGAVGIDVEPISDQADPAAIARLALSMSERAVLDRIRLADRVPAVTTWWTRKEAVLKATGWGLAVAPDQLTVSSPDRGPELLGWGSEREPPPGPLTMFELSPGPGHVACLALLAGRVQVTERDGSQVLQAGTGR